MKNNKKYSFFISVLLFILSFVTVDTISCQPWRKPRMKIYNKYMDTNDFKPKPPAPDTVANREFSIDFEKLSKLAIINAYSSAGGNINGSIVLRIDVDTNSRITSIMVLESSNKVLNPLAINALKKYFKRYKPKVAKKDGKPIVTKDYLVPIVFDMSIIENK